MIRHCVMTILAAGLATCAAVAGDDSDMEKPEAKGPTSVHGITVQSIDGQEVKLSDYAGSVMVIVNVASK